MKRTDLNLAREIPQSLPLRTAGPPEIMAARVPDRACVSLGAAGLAEFVGECCASPLQARAISNACANRQP